MNWKITSSHLCLKTNSLLFSRLLWMWRWLLLFILLIYLLLCSTCVVNSLRGVCDLRSRETCCGNSTHHDTSLRLKNAVLLPHQIYSKDWLIAMRVHLILSWSVKAHRSNWLKFVAKDKKEEIEELCFKSNAILYFSTYLKKYFQPS